MELGDKVLYYTHESNDLGPDVVRDELAFVLRVVDNNCLDVVVLPPGGPFRFERVCKYDADDPYRYPGGSYWREAGSEPPDFDEEFAYSNDPRWITLVSRQKQEAKGVASQDRDRLRERHIKEQDALTKQIDEDRSKAKAEDKPEPNKEVRR